MPPVDDTGGFSSKRSINANNSKQNKKATEYATVFLTAKEYDL